MTQPTLNNIRLGNRVHDLITGFSGIAVNRTEFMNGNTQFSICPVASEGKDYPDSISLDYHTLEVIDEGFADRATEPTFKSGIVLGNEVECMVTGIKGIATHKTTYMNGCSSYLVVEKFTNNQTGQRLASEDWIDQTRLKVMAEGIAPIVKKSPADAKGNTPGGAPLRGIPRG